MQYIYNVWNDDRMLDEWTYSAKEALAIRAEHNRTCKDEALVTRYEEDIQGNVNTIDNFVRMSDTDLLMENS